MPKLVFDEEKLYEIIDRIVKRTFEMDFEWDWPGGVAFYGVAEAYEATKNEEYLHLLKEWIDERLEDGLPKLSVNGVSIGHTLLSLYEATGDDRYLDTAKQMADYVLHEAPRFADGILQHTVNSEKHVFPEQAWVDTMMMAGLFLLRIGRLAGNDDYFEDGLRQFHGHEEFLQDMDTNLYYHAWDHQAKHNLSGVFWARGNGWAALTMAKALPLIDVTHPSYMIIDGSLRDLLSALARLQHSSGLWHTVLTDPDSYLEVSGSAGIAAGLLAKGSLYHKYIQKSLTAITEAVREDGRVERVSAGTAVMPDAGGYKDVPFKRIQGWGQGLVLTFLADVVRSKSRVFQ
ncbi:glycoside hydrolase family 88/105 protein [Bacillus glycinifermentans]|uniref:glycoside hydrolase family 88/105 protein n=1 Tax=Bacillus glycinifermentans TaxID=1664069 RepID=UPI001FF4EAA1|nr:glycoside hydrolase family 88 protein [Bacillus glycinifermentans]MEC3606752.1 glycoside hydrolase family 88 protein [Bacillus glycinifermentans]UOY88692.1 glycoside hydrolase family 88 protein [Bacillus glycinifermentans]